MLHVLVDEHAAAPGLGAEPVESRIAAVDRELKMFRQRHLVRGHAERQDERDLRVAEERPDPTERPGPREQLARERLVPAVDERDRVEPAPRFRRVELRDEREVVVEDALVDRLRGDVDHARSRCSQEAEDEAQEALLVRREHRDEVIRHVQADRMDDDDRPLDVSERAKRDSRPDAPELGLEIRERLLRHARTLLRRRLRC